MLLQANVNWFRCAIFLNNSSKQFQTKISRKYNIFSFLPQMCTYASFFPPCFSCHCVGFLFLYFWCFLYSFTKMKAYTVCATAQASIFTVFWPFTGSQRNCQIVEDVWTMIEQVVKSKDVRKQTRKLQGVGGHFFINWVRNVIEKAVSIWVIIQQDWKVKKTST